MPEDLTMVEYGLPRASGTLPSVATGLQWTSFGWMIPGVPLQLIPMIHYHGGRQALHAPSYVTTYQEKCSCKALLGCGTQHQSRYFNGNWFCCTVSRYAKPAGKNKWIETAGPPIPLSLSITEVTGCKLSDLKWVCEISEWSMPSRVIRSLSGKGTESYFGWDGKLNNGNFAQTHQYRAQVKVYGPAGEVVCASNTLFLRIVDAWYTHELLVNNINKLVKDNGGDLAATAYLKLVREILANEFSKIAADLDPRFEEQNFENPCGLLCVGSELVNHINRQLIDPASPLNVYKAAEVKALKEKDYGIRTFVETLQNSIILESEARFAAFYNCGIPSNIDLERITKLIEDAGKKVLGSLEMAATEVKAAVQEFVGLESLTGDTVSDIMKHDVSRAKKAMEKYPPQKR